MIYSTNSVNKGEKIKPVYGYLINKEFTYSKFDIDYSNFKWESSDKNIFTVDNNGNITGVNGGSATLKVGIGSVIKEYQINVISKITGVSLNKTKLELSKGSSIKLDAIINPIDTTENKEVTWKSSDENIAIVDSSGLVTAKSTGEVVITVTTSNGLIDTCTITVTNQLKGDFSKNGEVKLDDAIIGLRKVFGYISSDDNDLAVGDLNNNGKLDLSDIIVLLRYIFGYIKNI